MSTCTCMSLRPARPQDEARHARGDADSMHKLEVTCYKLHPAATLIQSTCPHVDVLMYMSTCRCVPCTCPHIHVPMYIQLMSSTLQGHMHTMKCIYAHTHIHMHTCTRIVRYSVITRPECYEVGKDLLIFHPPLDASI